jgi:hypothetical protein
MASLSIVWRNPNASKTVRCWAHVKRDPKKSLYIVMESSAAAAGGWQGLPALEVVRGCPAPAPQAVSKAAPRRTGIIQRFLSGS